MSVLLFVQEENVFKPSFEAAVLAMVPPRSDFFQIAHVITLQGRACELPSQCLQCVVADGAALIDEILTRSNLPLATPLALL